LFFSISISRSKEEKCTKAQSCSSGICTWNQHIIFFDIDTIDNIILWIKLINLEHNQEVLGEIKFHKLNLNNKTEWYHLNGLLERYFHIKKKEFFISYLDSSFHRVLLSTTNNQKRQLPDIPTAQLNANREKGIISI